MDGQRRLPRRARLVDVSRSRGAALSSPVVVTFARRSTRDGSANDGVMHRCHPERSEGSAVALGRRVVAAPRPSAVGAQDTRTVVEPKFPAPCATLAAELSPVADTTLADADEGKLDTRRIQQAIDGCAGGRAVVLKANGARRAFLTGPLTLKRGVTLVVDTNAILFASRNPRDYDIDESKRCGTVDEKGHACKALITTERATGSGVMGPGTIDGRGWAKLIGRDSSWWDLAQLAKVNNQEPELSASAADQSHRRLHALQDHAQELAELPRRLRSRQRIHRVGRGDQHARQARAQHRRHRSGERDERHDHPQLHQHRRRRRRDQGRQHRRQHEHHDLAQPLLSRPRRVHRQRDRRRRARHSRASISRSTAPTTACASSRTRAAAVSCTTSSTTTSASATRRT